MSALIVSASGYKQAPGAQRHLQAVDVAVRLVAAIVVVVVDSRLKSSEIKSHGAHRVNPCGPRQPKPLSCRYLV